MYLRNLLYQPVLDGQLLPQESKLNSSRCLQARCCKNLTCVPSLVLTTAASNRHLRNGGAAPCTARLQRARLAAAPLGLAPDTLSPIRLTQGIHPAFKQNFFIEIDQHSVRSHQTVSSHFTRGVWHTVVRNWVAMNDFSTGIPSADRSTRPQMMSVFGPI